MQVSKGIFPKFQAEVNGRGSAIAHASIGSLRFAFMSGAALARGLARKRRGSVIGLARLGSTLLLDQWDDHSSSEL
jgi:hypothetical protein